MLGLLAKKVGMTQIFDDNGNVIPVTVVKVDPNTVVAHKTEEKDGYNAVLMGLDDKKKYSEGKKRQHVTKSYAGQFPENIAPKRHLKEMRDFEKEVAVGDTVGIELFEKSRYVDVTGISKGKGFQGVFRRYDFGGGRATHGSKFHREPGSTGQCGWPSKTFKNRKMPGRMGREQTTVLSLKVIAVDMEKKVLLIKGAVPGINKGLLVVRNAVKR